MEVVLLFPGCCNIKLAACCGVWILYVKSTMIHARNPRGVEGWAGLGVAPPPLDLEPRIYAYHSFLGKD